MTEGKLEFCLVQIAVRVAASQENDIADLSRRFTLEQPQQRVLQEETLERERIPGIASLLAYRRHERGDRRDEKGQVVRRIPLQKQRTQRVILAAHRVAENGHG